MRALQTAIVSILASLTGCASTPPNAIVVSADWQRLEYRRINWGSSTTMQIRHGPHTAWVEFSLEEGVKSVSDGQLLSPEQQRALEALLPIGRSMWGDTGLEVDRTARFLDIDGRRLWANQNPSDVHVGALARWFDAYEASLRHSATTRPWFAER